MVYGRFGLIDQLNFSDTQTIGIIVLILLVALVLKALALWHSARRKQTAWFIFLLIINSLGILPLIYLILNKGRRPKG